MIEIQQYFVCKINGRGSGLDRLVQLRRDITMKNIGLSIEYSEGKSTEIKVRGLLESRYSMMQGTISGEINDLLTNWM